MSTVKNAPSYAVLLAAAGLAAGAARSGLEPMPGIPTGPWEVGALGAALGLVVRLWPQRGSRRMLRVLAVAGAVASLLTLAAALPRVPWAVLYAVSWLISLVTRADRVLEADGQLLGIAGAVALLAAAGATTTLAVRDARRARGLCARCGRRSAAAPPVPLVWLRRLAAVAAIAPLPYGALKVAWGLGWHGGLKDPHLFDGVTLLSPGFGDTAVLAGVGVATAVAMARPVRGGVMRAGVTLVGTVGSTMLLPVGVLGSGSVIGAYLGVVDVTDDGMHLWVFTTVYGGFLVWGLALAPLTFLYLRATRADCSEHEGAASELCRPSRSGRSSRAVGTMGA